MCGEMFSGGTQIRDISNSDFGLRNAEFRILSFFFFPMGRERGKGVRNRHLGTAEGKRVR